ncbi:MAG: ROK family protein [Microthrixaceae bacterium]
MVTPTRHVVGIDVGGTKCLGLTVRLDDGADPEVVDREQVPSAAGGAAALEAIDAVVDALVARSPGPVTGVGLGLAGFVDRDGVVRSAPNSGGLVGHDLPARLAARLGVPVRADNDANCVAVAAVALLRPPVADLVAVTLGTGIGGAVVVEGRLVRGAQGFAGEPGHMVVDPHGPRCPCGRRGCWERYASGSGLGVLAREAATAGLAPALVAAAGGSVDDVRGEHVADLLAAGDPGAAEVYERWADWVALGVANLVVLLDPEVVVLGGGATAGAGLVDRVARRVAADPAAGAAGRRTPVVAAPGGPDAGAIGAALLSRSGGAAGRA